MCAKDRYINASLNKSHCTPITITSLSSPKQLTKAGEYKINNIDKSFCAAFTDYSIGDFYCYLFASNFDNGCLYGTLVVTSPRFDCRFWTITILDGVATNAFIHRNSDSYLPNTGGSVNGNINTTGYVYAKGDVRSDKNIYTGTNGNVQAAGGVVHAGGWADWYFNGDNKGSIFCNANDDHFTIRANNRVLFLQSTKGFQPAIGLNAWGTDAGKASFNPTTNGWIVLGTNASRFKDLYLSGGVNALSDRNSKENIVYFDGKLAEKFIMSLKPASYKFKNKEDGENHDRTHYGFISQDIEEFTLPKCNMTSMDFAGFCKEDGVYSLRYQDFISPLVRMVQYQQEKIDDLERRLKKLEEKA